MKYLKRLYVRNDGSLWIKEQGGAEKRIYTVHETRLLLKKSNRQIYRYLNSGILNHYGKLLGAWLIDYESVVNLANSSLKQQLIPRSLKHFFPEYEISDLNAGRDRVVVISRILEYGSLNELSWLNRRYSEDEIKACIKSDGARLLSSRSLNFWALFYNISPKLASFRLNSPWSI